MLYYDRIDVSDGTDVNKTSESKEYDIYHYWHFLNQRFKFQTYSFNRCHDFLMMYMKLAILKIRKSDYRCIITGISKIEVM